LAYSCVKPYEPRAIKADKTFLVVDGMLLSDSSSPIKLSRTRNLSDTGGTVAKVNARVYIEGKNGDSFTFHTISDGQYLSDNPSLDAGKKYRLKIITSNSRQYVSEYVVMQQTPPIDSVQWDQPDEPVIGYLSASSEQRKRIFIKNNELRDRKETTYSALCKETLVARDSAAYFLADGSYLPAYCLSNGPLAIASRACVDCRVGGGTTTKPSFRQINFIYGTIVVKIYTAKITSSTTP